MIETKPVVTSAAPKASGLRKLRPQVRLTSAVLERFSPPSRELLRQVLSETLECVYDQEFRRSGAERELLGSLPDEGEEFLAASADDSGMDLLAPRRHRVLTAEEERALFLRFNYCRYRTMLVVRRNQGKRLGSQALSEILGWVRQSLLTRNAIVRLNTSLVMAMARRTKTVGVELADLISEGNLALLRCVDKFDCARGFKFSTYACRAILKSFSRVATRTSRHRVMFPTEFDPALERSDFAERSRASHEGDCVHELKSILLENEAQLSEVERQVILARFNIDAGANNAAAKAKTLEQVGEMIGVTKERVRQIQNKALGKLRAILEQTVLAR
jgi:RNA polymerase primary sigma factor